MTQMLTQPTIENTIFASLDNIRHRLAQVPLDPAEIERIYGLAAGTALQLATEFPVMLADRDLWPASVTFSFSGLRSDQAAQAVADLLSGIPGDIRLTMYVRTGVLGVKTIRSMPDLIGVLNSVRIGKQFVFRLPSEGYEDDFTAGESVPTTLWCCQASDVDLIPTYDDFAVWKSKHAVPYAIVAQDQLPYPVIHAECTLRLTRDRIHMLANLPEVTAILLSDNEAFR